MSAATPNARRAANCCPHCTCEIHADSPASDGALACPGCGVDLRYFHRPDGLHVFQRDVLEKTTRVMADKLVVTAESITPFTTFEELGADSLDVVEATMELEAEFDVTVEGDEADAVRTVGDAVRAVEQALAAKKR
jgi:acyl carrier protein